MFPIKILSCQVILLGCDYIKTLFGTRVTLVTQIISKAVLSKEHLTGCTCQDCVSPACIMIISFISPC